MANRTTYINFIATIEEKPSSLLMFILTEQLRSGVANFRINIASGGGTIFHAVSIFNFISGIKNAEIHTHNLGQIDSSANLIFQAGHKRTASKSSTFLLHPPKLTFTGGGSLSIEELKERIDSLEMDEEKMAEIISKRISKPIDQIRNMFKERKTYASEEAKNIGLIDSIDEFVIEPGTPVYTITNQS